MNKRTVSIIYELCNLDKNITISDPAESFQVSQRTIRNDLNSINELLRENGFPELKLKNGGQIIRNGSSFELAMRALRTGYTSIMIDGSHETFEDNIAVTKAVVDACHLSNVPVEAELGKAGGKEDDLDGGDENPYTDPEQAKTFVEATEVDSLAVAIGTAHGIYKGIPKLDVDRLSEIREVVSIPLVLHGTSGVPDEAVKECIKRGICKVNYATDLGIAFSKGINAVLKEKPDTIDPKKYNAQGREEVKQYVMNKIRVCGSVEKR